MEEREIFAHAAAVSEPFQERLALLADHPLVGDARGVGLLGAVELVADKDTRTPFPPGQGVGAHCQERCESHGLILRALGDVVAICPPLIISEDQVDELFAKLERALDDTFAWVH